MKNRYLAVAGVFLLSGCAAVRVVDQGYQSFVFKNDPRQPNVWITDGSPVIDQEPIVLTKINTELRSAAATTRDVPQTTIAWALPWLSDYVFHDRNDVTIYTLGGGTAIPADCKVAASKKVITCSYTTPPPSDSPPKYKYRIQLYDKTSTYSLDPTIWN